MSLASSCGRHVVRAETVFADAVRREPTMQF
jgi:hypothetical protein